MRRPNSREIARQTARVVTNGHLVVVQDEQHIWALVACMSQGFEGHTTCNRTITNDGYNLAINTLLPCRQCHAHGGGNAGRGVANTKGVELALATLWESAQATLLAHRAHALSASRQYFVWVTLVADIPNDSVFRCVENMV